jgi:hypothetical protein
MRRTGTVAIGVALAEALSSGLAAGNAQTSFALDGDIGMWGRQLPGGAIPLL